ncbi:ACP S-malonyltransferase [Clostridium sp. cel8]|jgi:[acyl-carrier-protein] S-malonyltransferase|uniref:ACP S-malonyltransferase n=1 Tax=unclassified Clostridium TaxID=2614128 RepID=UPI0015F3ACA5|nr:ACP S-malonyltransferase [Clostridium sp. cel8]MBA5851693.1 ACP S-malonyltransferase [Clostridium sp. cel8]
MGKIAFLFSGQGAQYVGMGKELYDNIKSSKEIFETADRVLGFSISNMCFSGPKEDLDETENTQPAILTMSIAALTALNSFGVKADITAGLSLGEYSALVASGVIKFEDAVSLVKKRGRYMQQAVPYGKGAMFAVMGSDISTVNALCKEYSSKGVVEITNLNCPGQIVISGEKEVVEEVAEKLLKTGARRVVRLSVSGPFHTSLMKPAAEKLEKELASISISNFKIPLITNVTGEIVENVNLVKPYLKKQVMSTVYFEKTIRNMINIGVDTFIEVGPGKVLSSFVKKVDRKSTILNVQDMDSLNRTIERLNK